MCNLESAEINKLPHGDFMVMLTASTKTQRHVNLEMEIVLNTSFKSISPRLRWKTHGAT